MICQSCRAALRTQRLSPLRLLSLARPSPPPATISTAAIANRPSNPLLRQPSTSPSRLFSTTTPSHHSSSSPPLEDPETPHMTPAEASIAALLTSKLQPTQLLVQDISGGCGSMYAIDITSPAFKGLTILKQQRLVNAALGDLVKEWHGVQIRTKVPPAEA